MPLISVLIPCYNAQDTVGEALQSLARQTCMDFEVILLDDGSQDGTLSVLERWSAMDSRFKVISKSHGGIISALNHGLRYCRGQFIARMDSDDRCMPNRFAQQLAYLESNRDVALVSCRVQPFPAEDVRDGFRIYLEWMNSLVSDMDIRREIFIESPFAHPSVLIRREWLDQMGGYEEHGWPEDYDLWMRMFLAGARFARLPDVLLEWREHRARLTRVDSRYSLENFLRLKAHYLMQGPIKNRDAVILWGAGMTGRRLSKHLARQGAPLAAFIDIDPEKIGGTRRGLPIFPPVLLADLWRSYNHPVILAAVGARGARTLIRQRLSAMQLVEGVDWWCVA